MVHGCQPPGVGPDTPRTLASRLPIFISTDWVPLSDETLLQKGSKLQGKLVRLDDSNSHVPWLEQLLSLSVNGLWDRAVHLEPDSPEFSRLSLQQ